MAAGRGEKAARGRPEGVGGVKGECGEVVEGESGDGSVDGKEIRDHPFPQTRPPRAAPGSVQPGLGQCRWCLGNAALEQRLGRAGE